MEQKKQTVVCLVVSFLSCIAAHAQRELYTNALPGDSLIAGKTLTTKDTVFFNPSLKPTIAQTNSVNNIINFSLNEFSGFMLPDSFNVTLTVRVIYENKDNLIDSISSKVLTINYNKNTAYSNKAIVSFQNAYLVQVKIESITAQYASIDSILKNLQLENDIDVNRSYLMDCTNDAVQTISDSTSGVETEGELKVFWTPSRVAQQYDLEWAWVDKSALDAGVYDTSGQLNPALIFKNNATRVTITGREYSIPLLYDGDGSLFFRVRGTQVQNSGEVSVTSWSSDFISSGGLGRYDFTGHARSLNWQASTSFAEDGKRKSVVQYFDGSLRSRQTVTKDNTTNTTVVAETFYDKQGRPAIQVLPSPTLSSIINYTPMFNVGTNGINGIEYDKGIYDTLESASDYCSGMISKMDTSSGASKYYSPANPKVDSFYHRFIPSAHGYPFAETQYTQDNTGRIYRQGGVDSMFQISRGHETKYYYGSPEQTDLDALFGTEAGDASHYQKNMVRDANGQYSVSYVDMNGKTVATALAGRPPGNMNNLSSFGKTVHTNDLLRSNNLINGTSIQSTKSLLVTIAGPQIFTYKMDADSMTIQDCHSNNICYDCLYNLNITITDNCNNQLIGGAPIVINKQNFQLFRVDTSCGVVIPMDTSFTYTLEEGEYNITKTLSISKYGMQYYHDSLFMPHNTCRTYLQILTEQMDSIRSRFDCLQPTDSTPTYTSYKEQMLLDLTPPSGQYADTSSTILYQNVAYDNNGFSIFNFTTYNYQNLKGGAHYLDENGNYDSVQNTLGQLVSPEQLTIPEFVANFKDSWANSLLDQHPEYCLLKNYDTLSASLKWDDDFQNTDTYAAAVAKGYLNPTGNTTQLPASNYTPLNVDPLYSLTPIDVVTGNQIGTEARSAIEDSLFNFPLPAGSGYSTITQWNLATVTVKCHDSSSTSCFYTYRIPANAFGADSLCTGDLDMAWRSFRGFYENAKASWIDHYIRSQCGNAVINTPYVAVFQQAGPVMASQGYPASGGDLTSDSLQGVHNLGKFYQDNCTGYAQAWWEQLAPCTYTSADSTVIMPRLIRVCEMGSDVNHMLGSSSISPDSSYRFSSFEDVIKQYNDSAYGGSKNINRCNSYLITKPLPYNQSVLLVNKPLWTKPDGCECSKITNYYNQYLAVEPSYSNFSDYIQQNLGTTMAEGALDSLRNLCNGTIPCNFISNPINLPPALQCSVNSVCASCLMVQEWNDSFMIKFPGQVPTSLERDTVQRNTNELFASFMNYQSGFSYTAQDYLTFMDSCSMDSASNGSCSFQNWTVYNPGIYLNINNDLFNAAYDNILPVNQFFSGSTFIAPIAEDAAHFVLVDKVDSIRTTDSIVIMKWRVKPAALQDMINPIIQTGANTYSGAEWVRDLTDPSWLIGSTRIKVIGGKLKAPGLQSNSYGVLADWVKIISGSTSSVLFSDDFLQGANCPLPGLMLCGKSQALDSSFVNVQTSPCDDTTAFAISTATQIYNAYKDSLSDYFNEAYTSKCLNAINLESFTVTDTVSEYHYTLYYYDQAGNLIKTIPPEGVHPDWDTAWLSGVEAAKVSGIVVVPAHTLATVYRYNSLSQVVSQKTPDAGISSFWYDKLGRLTISQNSKQSPLNNYSYTLYDYIGRIREVGQKLQPTAMSNTISRDTAVLAAWINFNNTTFNYNKIQVTSTIYDVISPSAYLVSPRDLLYPATTFFQQPYTLRNRVSATLYYDVLTNTRDEDGDLIPQTSLYTTGTSYAYDIHGNVDTLLQDYRSGVMADNGSNRFKEITYNYDLISGKVNEADYQPGAIDQFYHRYEYDAENRITDVYTSDNKTYVGNKSLEEHEAFYQYYKHGPLARAVVGQQQVQGLDYAYTLEGWLKGVNNTTLQSKAGTGVLTDMGSDGVAASPNHFVAQDAYGFNLNYFTGDYFAIKAGVSPFPGFSGLMPSGYNYRSLFNGNISAMAVNISKLDSPLLYNYQYDQLNRIVAMDAFTGLNQSTNSWSQPLTATANYRERVAYDANGNILKYYRNGTTWGSTPLGMDSLTYKYFRNSDGTLRNNRLRMVRDSVPSGNYTEDIDDQLSSVADVADSNYLYDAIGNLVKDKAGNIDNIAWTVYGKISIITKTDGTIVSYTYDAAGNRISKTVTPLGTGTPILTWYVRDASGNVMAVYTATGSDSLYQSEQHLYGSNRLGIYNRNINADGTLPTGISANLIRSYFTSNFARGNKLFELSNHLGNVLVTVSDKKIGHDGGSGTIDYYTPDVVTANDYYPLGSIMPGRQYSIANTNYRYGFNGKEKENDIEGSVYDYGFRIYNPQIGRFLSVDPLINSYPYYTPYQFAGNMPIAAIDLDGLEQYVVTYYKDQNNTTSKLEVRAVFDNNDMKNPLNQHIHKSGTTKDIAKGNVLVFEIKKDKDGRESMKIVDRKNNNDLTKEEEKSFKKTNANLESERGAIQTLNYGTDKEKLYESAEFENAKTKTFDSELGIVPPPNKPKPVKNPTTNTKKVVELEIFVTGPKGPSTDWEANHMLPGQFKDLGTEENKIYSADIVILKRIVHYNTDPKTMKTEPGTGGHASGELRVTKTYTISK